ncbi:DUF4245 domain-containing protein [Streptomyces sp. enrichment culture]|uniref:DUF4245 domain-containing protein n=1 Tax=Streptomyces sp. enrichment culture TaxID=1795815 RepID=UPI003F54C85E
MAGTNGKQKTARDMILSLAVVVLVGGVMWLFIPHDDDAEPDVKRVDYRVELLTARRAAPYPVAAPEGLPEAWKPTSVRFRGDDSDRWHLGYHTPDGEYVAVEQSTEKRSRFIEEASQGARETGVTQEIGGRTWVRYTGSRYDALVLEDSLAAGDSDGSAERATTVVTGTASFDQLAKVAAALRTA